MIHSVTIEQTLAASALATTGFKTIRESCLVESVPQFALVSLDPILEIDRVAGRCPGHKLSQSLHLAGEKVALWRSPGPVTERLMLHDLDQKGVIRCRFIFSGKNDEPTPDFSTDTGFLFGI